MDNRITVLALDLQGTLISNAVSQIPRPGLRSFLDYALGFERVALYTTVSASRTERILHGLCEWGDAPPELLRRWEHVAWSGPLKDLGFISAADPHQCVLVDNKPERVVLDQRTHYIPIKTFSGREAGDAELERVAETLRRRVASA